jgi:hypothetical protein
MLWWQFALLGASGGAIVECIAVFRCVTAWQEGRRNRDGTLKRTRPELRRYLDIPAHTIMLPARAVLGAAAALLLGVTGQVSGPYGAVVLGCAAPIFLAQLGSIHQVEAVVKGTAKPRKSQAALPVHARTDIPVEESHLG